jgi:hypothetical protein
MRYLQPIRLDQVTPGMVITDGANTPRAVLGIGTMRHRPGVLVIYLEGLPPIKVYAHEHAQPVELDAADAIGNLHAAGLNPAPIEGN